MNKKKKSIDKIIVNEKSLLSKYIWGIIGCILLLTSFLYGNSLFGDFLDYDDLQNVVNNIQIRHLNFENIKYFFTTSNLFMYSPLTFISYAIDFKIDGLQPFYFKLTNLILHLINLILVYVFSNKLLKKNSIAILITFLFALHPVNPDTVAWISARSNLLYTLFFLLSLIFYLMYIEKKKYLFLIISIITFGFSLLSKSAAVMLPFILLGIDYFLKRKIWYKLFVEKIPFFILSIIIGLIAVYFRTDTETTQTTIVYTLFDRFFIICYSFLAYFLKALYPFGLSEIYGYPLKINGFLPVWYYVSPFVITLIAIVLFKIRNLKREILIGIYFFIVTIIITQISLLEDGFTANRYAYLPYIGFYLITAIAIDSLVLRFRKLKIIFIGGGLIILTVFSVLTYQRSLVWMNTLSLFNHAIEQSPDAAFAYNSRGIAKYGRNDLSGALSDYNAAIKFNPVYAGAYYNRGIIFYAIQDYEKALNDYSKAIELNAKFASAFCARGILQMDIFKNNSLAMLDFNKSIQINPSFVQAYYNRGMLEMRINDNKSACKDFWVVKNMGYFQADGLIEQYCK